eukprot:Rhum_TRINITY_DN10366_c0_g2::Rhum_TRINITY_DN10366_c0_g2_i1::g.38151::m.38151
MPTEEQQAAAPASSDADAAAPVAAAVAAAASSSSSPPPSSDAAAAAPESKKRKVDVAVPSSPPAHTDPEAEEEDESDNELHDLLGCQQCKFPLVHAEDIMMTSAAEISSSVYRYNLELDLCNEEIPCYSSDNPHGVRFDVVRTKAHSYVAASPPEESSHSFFPGFAWTNISCGRCSKHLGWGFSKNVDPAASAAVAAVLAVAAGASVASVGTVGEVAVATEFDYTQVFEFFGLVLTKLSPIKMTKGDIREERERMREDVVCRTSICSFLRLPQRAPCSQAAAHLDARRHLFRRLQLLIQGRLSGHGHRMHG